MTDLKSINFNRIPILGQPKVDFDDWKFSFERWCTSNKVGDEEKVECLISLTEGIAKKIVINSLDKTTPDDFDTIINKLQKHYKGLLPKNSRLLELSTITIRKGENVSEFNIKFDTLLNKIKIELGKEVIISYYINAFRNLSKTYEALLEAEPKSLEDAMKITIKKEKIYNLVESNRPKNKESQGSQNNNKKNYNMQNNSNNNYNKNTTYYNNNSKSNYQKYNSNNNNIKSNYNNVNQSIENRRISLKPTQVPNDELQEITQKLADLKINVCLNCQRIGHVKDDCPELEEEHLN